MKILVLMPTYLTHEDYSYAIWSKMTHEAKEKSFSMPMFASYLQTANSKKNVLEAYFDTLLSVERIYENLKADEDLIVFGNMPKKYKFDIVFSFQDGGEKLAYDDPWLRKVEEIVDEANDEVLNRIFDKPFYAAEDAYMELTNCLATADFLSAYLQTDPKLDKIKKEYEERVRGKR